MGREICRTELSDRWNVSCGSPEARQCSHPLRVRKECEREVLNPEPWARQATPGLRGHLEKSGLRLKETDGSQGRAKQEGLRGRFLFLRGSWGGRGRG